MFVTSTTGHGGWPLSVFLTPYRKPFFGGTYFRPDDTSSMPGFKSILTILAKEWKTKPEAFLESSEKSMKLLKSISNQSSDNDSPIIHEEVISKAMEHYRRSFDPVHGGFGSAPKFPQPVNLQFILDYVNWKGSGPEKDSWMIEKTLNAMWHGGIHDHVGMGFHRYSVDRRWHIPHFEKMLYDQGQLLKIYSQASINLDVNYDKTIEDIVAYVQNNLSSPTGTFYCAEDADSKPQSDSSEKKEGAFAVWTHEQVRKALGDGLEGNVFCAHFDIKEEGNVHPQHDIQGELKGVNVLREVASVYETAKSFSISTDECNRVIEGCKRVLHAIRVQRPKPHLDDKILVNWNAFMMQGLIHAFYATSNASHLHMATRAFKQIKETLFDGDHLMHTEGVIGFAEDYAMMIAVSIDLWEATLETKYLDFAIELQGLMDRDYWDQSGGYFQASSQRGDKGNDSSLPLRVKDSQDGAEPGANSVATMNLLRLHLITGKEEYLKTLEKLKTFVTADINTFPSIRPALLSALVWEEAQALQLSLFGPSLEAIKEHHHALLKLPFRVITSFEPQNTPKVQVCRGSTCIAPIDISNMSPKDLLAQIKAL